MSEGVVVVAGVFPAGSVVVLHRCEDERALRPGGGGTVEVGRKTVDERGNVGWDGVEAGVLHLIEGYIDGVYTLMRQHAMDADAPDFVAAQPPARTVDVKQGTDSVTVSDPPPNPPDDLESGVPDGAQLPVYDPDAQNTGGQADAVPADESSTGEQPVDPAAPAPAAEDGAPADAPAPSDVAATPEATPAQDAPVEPAPPTDGSVEQAPPSQEVEVTSPPSDVPAPDVPVDGQGQPVQDAPAEPEAVPVGTPPVPADAEPAEGNAPPVEGEPAPAAAPEDAAPAEAAPAADEPAPEVSASDAQAPSGAEQTSPSGEAEQPAVDPAAAETPPDQPAQG